MWVASGEIGSVCVSLWVGSDPVISRPVLPDGVRRTHGFRGMLQIVLHRQLPVKAVPLNLYRQKPCWRSNGA